MKKQIFSAVFILVFAAELIALIVFAVKSPDFSQDTVAVNEVLQSVTQDFGDMQNHTSVNGLDYVVLDGDGAILFKTCAGLTETENDAIKHRDTLLHITIGGVTVGRVIIYNDGAEALQAQKNTTVLLMSAATAVQCAICVLYAAYLYGTVIRPFGKLKTFAARIAGGNLDVPLEMDRHNLFGAFTESFDIMRSELKKARIAEAQANASKKELVAKLSHDIKTPVASIKAVSEVGLAVAADDRDRANYSRIIGKADQINTLVTNLFTATLEELQQLTVTVTSVPCGEIVKLLENADYFCRARIGGVPQCLVYADALRLQQVFDNIFANSYKYAGTDIQVSAELDGDFLNIVIEDGGGGVPQEEIPVLKEKFRRGGNSAGTDGAGLGLYISDYFMKEMRGGLNVENGRRGLRVTVSLLLCGKT